VWEENEVATAIERASLYSSRERRSDGCGIEETGEVKRERKRREGHQAK
jgi:hypothetical protein